MPLSSFLRQMIISHCAVGKLENDQSAFSNNSITLLYNLNVLTRETNGVGSRLDLLFKNKIISASMFRFLSCHASVHNVLRFNSLVPPEFSSKPSLELHFKTFRNSPGCRGDRNFVCRVKLCWANCSTHLATPRLWRQG